MRQPRSVNRIWWIEWVRALGCCAVVLLHVLVSTNLRADIGLQRQVAYIAVSVPLCRWAVPAFFMVSGFLLLDPSKKITWQSVRRYAWRMALVLLTFGSLFALMEEIWIARSAGMALTPAILGSVVIDVLTARSWDHLWYVYALLGIYLLLPVIRWIQARGGRRGFLLFTLVLFICLLAVPTIVEGRRILMGSGQDLEDNALIEYLRNLSAGVTCFCLGGCMREWQFNRIIVSLGIASVAIMLGLSIWSLVAKGADGGAIYLQGSCLASLYAIFVMLLVRHRASGFKPGTVVMALATDSFGIYVIHPLFVHLVLLRVDPLAFPPVLFEFMFFGVVLAASVATTRLVRRLPLVSSLI